MATQTQSGFTIIEVVLFLAISGALAVAILVGSGAAINQERYRDSVNSFKGLIQEQYNQVTNVVSSDTRNPVCASSADSIVFDDSLQRNRGTSECLVLGRFMLVEPTQVTTANVIARESSGLVPEGGDSAVLSSYSFGMRHPETREVAWRARIVEPRTSDGATASVLIVRSLLSGSILTYVRDGDHSANLSSMVDDDYMTEKNFCVDPEGMFSARRRLAVRVNARASNQSAIEIPLEGDNVCD